MNDNSSEPRTITLSGLHNCRDLGGLATSRGRVRRGLLFRSDRLSTLDRAGYATLEGLGIQTIIDMRSQDERRRAPNRVPRSLGIEEVSLPFLPRNTMRMLTAINRGAYDAKAAHEAMLRQYTELALDHLDEYRQIVGHVLRDHALPLLFHCTSGKDRTGMAAAIILLALGADESTVIEDYVITDGRVGAVEYLEETADPAAVAVVMSAHAAFMQSAVNTMRREFGSIANYLTNGIGLADPELHALRMLLLEPTPVDT